MANSGKVVVMVTCASHKEATHIAWALVKRRLAACVNVHGFRVKSFYRWKGKVESSAEHLLLIKTARRLLPKVQAEVARLHSSEVPEFIALPIVAGSARYLKWMEECLSKTSRSNR